MSNNYLVPGAIIVAGLLVVGAMIYSIRAYQEEPSSLSSTEKSFRPVSEADHIRGNIEAPVTVVEYVDLQCPFCRRFHPTMMKILQEFPEKVRWVYRHFPLVSAHPQAMSAALASECVAELGGNEAFWQFTDAVFENQERIGGALYQELATQLKIPREQFEACVASQKYKERIAQDLAEAEATGGRGTPWTLIIAKNGKIFPLDGALPFEEVRGVIERALQL